jgi:hypothetical protein
VTIRAKPSVQAALASFIWHPSWFYGLIVEKIHFLPPTKYIREVPLMMPIAVLAAALKAMIVLSVLVLIIGLIKPKWILFWMKEPNRILVSCIALLMFMGSMTAWSQFTVTQKPKAKTERERTRDEMNDLNLGSSPNR